MLMWSLREGENVPCEPVKANEVGGRGHHDDRRKRGRSHKVGCIPFRLGVEWYRLNIKDPSFPSLILLHHPITLSLLPLLFATTITCPFSPSIPSTLRFLELSHNIIKNTSEKSFKIPLKKSLDIPRLLSLSTIPSSTVISIL